MLGFLLSSPAKKPSSKNVHMHFANARSITIKSLLHTTNWNVRKRFCLWVVWYPIFIFHLDVHVHMRMSEHILSIVWCTSSSVTWRGDPLEWDSNIPFAIFATMLAIFCEKIALSPSQLSARDSMPPLHRRRTAVYFDSIPHHNLWASIEIWKADNAK